MVSHIAMTEQGNKAGERHVDVVILGGGLAGLALARQLLLETNRNVLLLERRASIPQPLQKVGESTGQLASHYFSVVLGMHDHLSVNHLEKATLRFFWKTAGMSNETVDDYSQSLLDPFTAGPSFQLDRNCFERALLEQNGADDRFDLLMGVRELDLCLSEGDGPHRVSGKHDGAQFALRCDWLVDCSGRSRLLARKLGLEQASPIRHSAFFWWVKGTVDIGSMTRNDDGETGHHHVLPTWLATSHFCEKGVWFWVIPLVDKTSLGMVCETDAIDANELKSVDRLMETVCRKFPLLGRDLPSREVLHFSGFKDFSYDCAHTLSPRRWAMSGDAGRFHDPLFSPGSDLIALHNTMITACIALDDKDRLERACATRERLLRALYETVMPAYTSGYATLEDQEAFSFKAAWDLSVYYGLYVFPFINDLMDVEADLPGYIHKLIRVRQLGGRIQEFLGRYCRWKIAGGHVQDKPVNFDLSKIPAVAFALDSLYERGLGRQDLKIMLARQLNSLEHMARYIAVHAASTVLGRPDALNRTGFVESFDLSAMEFDPQAWREAYDQSAGAEDFYDWGFDLADCNFQP